MNEFIQYHSKKNEWADILCLVAMAFSENIPIELINVTKKQSFIFNQNSTNNKLIVYHHNANHFVIVKRLNKNK